ncbi:MAG: hypothetical protein WCV70_01035 [Patescibacteria group bacterium]|jgi:hypothetical protein
MVKKIKVSVPFLKNAAGANAEAEKVRVKIIRAPLVDGNDLRNVMFYRARAVVL